VRPIRPGGLDPKIQAQLGSANTTGTARTRTSVTHNHDLSFSGGSEDTRYRASPHYMNQQGVFRSRNGLERIQGRLTATTRAGNRMRLGVNVTTPRRA